MRKPSEGIMREIENQIEYEPEADQSGFDWSRLFSSFSVLRNYIRLYPIVVAVWIIITFTLYAFTKPQYTAEALVGPPGPSPTDSMLSSITDGGVGGIARKVLGGSGASGSNDPYQEYLQLLPSSRLSQVLIEKDHLLQIIYSDRWDADTKRWKTGGPLHFVTDPIKRLLHRPIYYGPDTDTLTNYLSHSLTVVGSSNGAGSMLIPGTATYTKVSFEYDDPHQAEEILNTILLETDQIIREDQRRDVLARISFLRDELSRVTISDERSALISILSDQEQLLAMIQADHRYASNLIVTPYASPVPTSPKSPTQTLILAIVFSTFAWAAIVIFGPRIERVGQFIRRFERKPKE